MSDCRFPLTECAFLQEIATMRDLLRRAQPCLEEHGYLGLANEIKRATLPNGVESTKEVK